MAEWLIEQGIGEERAILLDGEEIAAARLHWPGRLAAGQVEDAILVARAAGARRGTARFAGGEEALVDRLPPSASEGATLRLEVTRPAIDESGRRKLAHARPTTAQLRPAPTLPEQLAAEGHQTRIVRRFPGHDWDELIGEAFAREVAFAGGSLVFAPTPAMLLIDIDGDTAPAALALAAVAPLARALRRFDIGGSVGIDFPTLQARAERRRVDEAIEAALAGWPHERTAMNGFGFVQIVARFERASLLQRAAHARTGLAARLLLRRAELLEGPGATELAGHPALEAKLKPAWLEDLARRTGRPVRWRADPALAIEAPHAQLVPL